MAFAFLRGLQAVIEVLWLTRERRFEIESIFNARDDAANGDDGSG